MDNNQAERRCAARCWGARTTTSLELERQLAFHCWNVADATAHVADRVSERLRSPAVGCLLLPAVPRLEPAARVRAPRLPRWSSSRAAIAVATADGCSEQDTALIAPSRRRPQPPSVRPLAGGRERLHWRRCQRTTEGHELPGGDAAYAPRRAQSRCRAAPAPLRHPAPPSHPAGGTGVADHRPPMNCRRCRYDRSPISAKRSCGAEYVDRYHYLGYTPLPGAQIATWSPASGACWRSSGLAQRLEGAPATASSAGALPNAKRLQLVVNNARFLILPWVQVRSSLPRCWLCSSRRLPDDWQARYGYRPLLLETFVSPTASPVPATAPPTGPSRSDPRPRQTGRASYPRAAQERHLALPAQARLPPPTLHPARSSPQ